MMAYRRRDSAAILKEAEEGKLLVEECCAGNLENVRQLLEAGVSVNAEEYNRCLFYKSQNYLSPLQCAAKFGHSEVAKLLIEHDADIDAKDRFDVTACHLAAEHGHQQCLQVILESCADCNVPTKYSKHGSYKAVPHIGGTTPLHLATDRGQLPCIRELILSGGDYNAVDEMGRTSLYVAAQNGSEEAVLAHMYNAIGRDILSLPSRTTGETPLHLCVRQGMLSGVKVLLQHGSDPNQLSHDGVSPLHLAVQYKPNCSLDMVRELVKSGYHTDVNQQDVNGRTPLMYVSFSDRDKDERRPQIAAFLIAYGARFESIKSKRGLTLLQQELRDVNKDRIILEAIVKSTLKLPKVENLVPITLMRSGHQRSITPNCQYYMDMTRYIRPLQDHCRFAVRHALQYDRLTRVNELPLPELLKNFLVFEHPRIS